MSGLGGQVVAAAVGPVSGLGLFSGKRASVTIGPASAPGIHLRRERASAAARTALVSSESSWTGLPPGVPVRNTTLASGPAFFATIEHLMSALAGLGVWHAAVKFEDGPEAPILDGSALPWVAALKPALGPGAAAEPLVLRERVEVAHGDATIVAVPRARGWSYTYVLDYGAGSPIRAQRAAWEGCPRAYEAEIAPARTFSLRREAEAARAMGLFPHLTPREMVVVGDDGAPIDNAWRIANEPAAHKLLDLIGDLALLGRPLQADVVATRSGHALTHEFCRRVLAGG
ncbi:MAG: UDP-3-O-acyl-N-acetylglucosamine deacetylase [Phycisphaerales bacterium]